MADAIFEGPSVQLLRWPIASGQETHPVPAHRCSHRGAALPPLGREVSCIVGWLSPNGAVLASTGFAIAPADRALRLLGRTARLTEINYRTRKAEAWPVVSDCPRNGAVGVADQAVLYP